MNPSIEGAAEEHLLQNFLKVTIAQYGGVVTSIVRGARGVLPPFLHESAAGVAVRSVFLRWLGSLSGTPATSLSFGLGPN